MKNLIFILLMFLGTLTINAQIIGQNEVPLENWSSNQNMVGKYFKDVNNLLDAYKGVWQWTDGSRELTFYLYIDEEVEMMMFAGNHYRDIIYGYYVYKENGVTLIDTKQNLINSPNHNRDVSRGGVGLKPYNDGYVHATLPALFFVDYSKRTCLDGVQRPVKGGSGLWRFLDASTARVGLYTAGPIISDCPGSSLILDLHPNFPSNSTITLTRIATEAPPLD